MQTLRKEDGIAPSMRDSFDQHPAEGFQVSLFDRGWYAVLQEAGNTAWLYESMAMSFGLLFND